MCFASAAVGADQVQRSLGNVVRGGLSASVSLSTLVPCDATLRASGSRNPCLTQHDRATDVHLQVEEDTEEMCCYFSNKIS